MCLDQTVVNIWRSSLRLRAQTQTHTVGDGWRWMVTGQTGLKKNSGGRWLSL